MCGYEHIGKFCLCMDNHFMEALFTVAKQVALLTDKLRAVIQLHCTQDTSASPVSDHGIILMSQLALEPKPSLLALRLMENFGIFTSCVLTVSHDRDFLKMHHFPF